MEYYLTQEVTTGRYDALLLGGEFDNCHGQGDTPEGAEMSLKLAVKARRRKYKMKTRNELSNIVSICSDNVVTVKCVFEPKKAVDMQQQYTFKATKDFAATIKPTDQVICRKNDGTFSVVIVASINDKCVFEEIDKWRHNWVFQKVDIPVIEDIEFTEECLIDSLEESQRASMQKAMIEAIGVDSGVVENLRVGFSNDKT